MKVLIDTHVLLWSIANNKQMRRRWIEILEDTSNEIIVSIASLWEIAIKVSTEKLELRYTLQELVERFVLSRGIKILQISVEHLDSLRQLPYHHRDPFDQLIIAQSIVEELEVITVDPKFTPYEISIIP